MKCALTSPYKLILVTEMDRNGKQEKVLPYPICQIICNELSTVKG